jgi:ribokinase
MPGQLTIPEQPTAIDLIGDVAWDTHLTVPHLPTPGREARATSRSRRLGGTAAQVARWLHLLAQAGLYPSAPPEIRLWTSLDATAVGELAFCDTSACALVAQIGEVFVLTEPDGEKAMISFVPPDLPLRPLPAQSTLFYLSAYTLLAPDAERQIVGPCERLVKKGARMVFDLAPLVQHMDRQLLRRLVGLAYIALGNEEEWSYLFQARQNKAAAQAALALGAGSVYLKRGAKGSILFCANGSSAGTEAAPSVPVNTTGAGDAYTAAILAAFAAGRNDHWALQLATYCGALQTEQRADAENIAMLHSALVSLGK